MNRKVEWIICAVGLVCLIGGSILNSYRVSAAESDVAALNHELKTLKNEVAVNQKATSNEKQKKLYETTGISQAQVADDTKTIADFFTPAFTWMDGKTYDANRDSYIETLGDNNTFVTTYMAENTSTDGYNKVDAFSLKSAWEKVDLYPTKRISETEYEYIAIVTFYLYKNNSDLDSKSKLTASQAIITCRVTGEEGARRVADVSAWSGFES